MVDERNDLKFQNVALQHENDILRAELRKQEVSMREQGPMRAMDEVCRELLGQVKQLIKENQQLKDQLKVFGNQPTE